MSQDTTQAKFRKAAKKDSEQPQIEENEVRIKGNMGNVKRYVDYACNLLKQEEPKKDDEKKQDNEENENKDDKKDDIEKDDKKEKKVIKTFKTIVLKATGRAINKAVTTAEVVKRRVAGLHQDTTLETLEIVDVWEPIEEGLKKVETTRRVASITIKLSIDPTEIEEMKKNPGYQPPISADAVKTSSDFPARRSYRGNRRGGTRYGSNQRGGNIRRGGYNRSYNSNYYNNRYRGGYNRRNNPGGSNYNRYNSSSRGSYGRYGGGQRGQPYRGYNRYNNRL